MSGIDWAGINRAAGNIADVMVRGADQAVQINQGMLNRNQQLNMQDMQNKHDTAMQTQRLAQDQNQFDMKFGLLKRQADLETAIKTEDFKAKVIGAVAANPSRDNYQMALGTLNKLGVDTSDAPKDFGANAMGYIKSKSMESGQAIELMAVEHQKGMLELRKQQMEAEIQNQQFNQGLSVAKLELEEARTGAEIGLLNAKAGAAQFGSMSIAPDGTETFTGPAVMQGTPGTQAIPPGMTKQAFIDLQKSQNKQLQEMNEDARAAQVAMNGLVTARNAVETYKGHQGFGGGLANAANGALGLVSADAESKYTQGQFLKSQSNLAALKTRVTEKMLGSLSDSDRKFLVDSVFSLNNTKETNLMIVDGMNAMGSAMIARAQFMQAWRNRPAGTLDGADEAFNTYMSANPVSRVDENGKVYFKPIQPDEAAKFALTYKPGTKVTAPKDKASPEQVSTALGKNGASASSFSKDEYEAAVAKHGKEKVDAFLAKRGG